VGAWIVREYGIDYQTRSGLIALLHRLGMEHRKPTAILRKLDPAKQTAFIKSYDDLLNQMLNDETVIFADAVHPRRVSCRRGSGCAKGCWPSSPAARWRRRASASRASISGRRSASLSSFA